MNKKDLINIISESTELSKKDVSSVTEALFETIVDTLAKDEKVSINGFGNFEPNHRNARKCRNPKTGETIDVPAKVVPVFKASSSFKNAL